MTYAEYEAASAEFHAAVEKFSAELIRLIGVEVRETFPGAVTLHVEGFYDVDPDMKLRARRVVLADGRVIGTANTYADDGRFNREGPTFGTDQELERFEEMTTDSELDSTLLDTLGAINGDDWMGAGEIDVAAPAPLA